MSGLDARQSVSHSGGCSASGEYGPFENRSLPDWLELAKISRNHSFRLTAPMSEYFREFAFVGALLGGFSLVLFGTLLDTGRSHRTVGPAAGLALASSSCFLIVTLGNTFAASVEANPLMRARLGAAIEGQMGPLSMLFLIGILVLLASFGAAGWIRSRRLGIATSAIAAVTLIGVVWVMSPFIIVR